VSLPSRHIQCLKSSSMASRSTHPSSQDVTRRSSTQVPLLTEEERCNKIKAILEDKLARLDQNFIAGCQARGTTVDGAKQLIEEYLKRCEGYARLDMAGTEEAARLLPAAQKACQNELYLLDRGICTGVPRLLKIEGMLFSLELCFAQSIPLPYCLTNRQR